MKTLIVNLFGMPGSGKSTTAAYLFSELKQRAISSELLTEYAKKFVWNEDWNTLRNQLVMLAEGTKNLEMLIGKVRVIINEQAMLTGLIYVTPNSRINTSKYQDYVLSLDDVYGGLNIFVDRPVSLTEEGARLEKTEEEALARLVKIKEVLALSKRGFISIKTPQELLDIVLEELKKESES